MEYGRVYECLVKMFGFRHIENCDMNHDVFM